MCTCLLIDINIPPTHIFLPNKFKIFQQTRLLCPQVYLVHIVLYITNNLCNSWKNSDLVGFFFTSLFLLALKNSFAMQLFLSSHERSVNFKMSFWCLQIFQITNEFFSKISALASKKKSNKKNKVTLSYKLWAI